MYITLAGEDAQFTNRLFNTIEIKPNSYICLNNLSLKKNEVINIGDGVFSVFQVDDNNFYKVDIPSGEYDVFSICQALEGSINFQQTRVQTKFDVVSNPDKTVAITITLRNAIQDITTCLSNDTYGNVYQECNVADENMSVQRFWYNNNSNYDFSVYQTFMDIGDDIDTQSYSIQADDQTYTSSNNQTFGCVPWLKDTAPTYVTSTGTPGAGWESQVQTENLVENAMIQADYQSWSNITTLPISVTNLISDANEKLGRQADLLRHQGAITFIVGSANSEKSVIICKGNQIDDIAKPPLPQNFNSFTTGSPNIYLWMNWTDPRDSQYESVIQYGANKATDGTWTTFNGRTVTGAFEVTQAHEGNKFYIDFEPQKDEPTPFDIYAPRIRFNTLSYEHPLDDAVTTVAFWDMDVADDNGVMFDSNDAISFGEAKFTLNGQDRCGYKPLWKNVGFGYHDGNYCSGHYWGTENVSTDNLQSGNDIGNGFELRTGVGEIDFIHASGSGASANSPGLFPTAYGLSRSFQSGAIGYQNAYFKCPNMYGGFNTSKPHPSNIEALEGTIFPAQLLQSGTNTVSICLRFDTATANQMIFAYEGVDSSNIPHALLAITPNSATGITVSNGDPTVRETLNIFELDGTTPSAGFPLNKWINIVVSFQTNSGDPSNWIVLAKDEDNNVYRATATACSGSPTRPLYGIGGNDACDGTQLTNTGFGGLMKLFKIRYYHGNSTAFNQAYNVPNLLASLMTDITHAQGDPWYDYDGQIYSNDVLDKDDLAIGFKGLGTAKSTDAMTVVCGQHITDSKISNKNPFDTLFSGLGFRQNFQPNLQERINEDVIIDGNRIVEAYLAGGNNDTQGYPGIVCVQDTGSIYRQLGLKANGGGGPFYIMSDILPITDITKFNQQKTDPIDTELGINNNRIHIDNLPIESYNAKVGCVDRCIYQTTAFLDQIRGSDATQISCIDVPQKIYIPLHNAGSIHLNEFNVKITTIDDIVDPEVISSNMTIEIKNQDELKITN